VPFPKDYVCVDCKVTFQSIASHALRCKPCRSAAKKARERIGTTIRDCARCGSTFKPYKGDQKYCSKECGYDAHLEAAGVPPERKAADEQMEKLFRYYKAKNNIEITDRPDGTRLVSFSDLQLPFVDEPLLDAVVEFVSDYKPHDIILNGDILDCYEVSDFDKRPERLFNLGTEFEMADAIVRKLKRYAAKDCQVWWVDGNHEERLQRAIWRRAQDFSFLVKDIPEALRLDDTCAGYVPYGKHIDYLGFVFTHGNFVSSYSAYTAKRHLERYRSSGVNGHTHRLGSYSVTDMHGRSHTWYEQGCLCRRDLEYVRGVGNWQQGFLIGTVANGALHPQLIHTIEADSGRGFYAGGKYYSIKDS
jgi:uncharacterized C2H2 Zn-finger protein